MTATDRNILNSASTQETVFFDRRPCSIIDASEAPPPSPILSPSVLTSTRTSEEVPLVLFNSESNDDIATRPYSIFDFLDEFRLSSSDSIGTIMTARTCVTAGTFGQFRRSHHSNNQRLSSPSLPQTIPNEASLRNSSSAESYSLSDPDAITVPSPDLKVHDTHNDSSMAAVSPPSPSPVYSTFSCTATTPSDRSYVIQAQTIRHSGYAGDLHSTSSLTNCPILHRDSAISLPNVSRHDRKASSASEVSHFLPLSLPPSLLVSAPSPMSSHAELPRSLAWLKDAVVEMLIDQEGFRSITPSFRFAGYSTNTRSLDPSDKGIEGGAVQFIPVTRQTFNFHYAPFDGQPVLRRISVNGATRDHVSRQATISLKSNGVYEVRGIETSLLPSKGDGIEFSAEPPKLRWKLDYYVDDRRGPGRCEGEKMFTPLTFSCSPLLLHPLQGRKIKLMHVMRKNVVTKLVAEKMELPKTTTSRSSSPVLREDSSSPTPVRIDPTKVQLWNLHRRFLSHGQSNTHPRPQSNENRMSDFLGTIQVDKAHFHYQQQIVSQQHQRASSGREVAVVDLRLGCQDAAETDEVKIDGIRHPMTDLSPNRGPPTVSHDRHILPPSKLSELLEIKTIRPQEQKIEIEQLFGGLTPAPRNLKSFGSK